MSQSPYSSLETCQYDRKPKKELLMSSLFCEPMSYKIGECLLIFQINKYDISQRQNKG